MNPSLPEHDFRAAMRRLASTVSVITCAVPDGWFGITATAVTSVCMEPPTLLICINRTASLHQHLHVAGRFCVNMLRSEQMDVAQAFSGQRHGQDRFNVGQWEARDGAVILRDAQASLNCTLVKSLEHGTHSIFLGQIESTSMTQEVSPLIYQDGAYAHARPLAELAAA